MANSSNLSLPLALYFTYSTIYVHYTFTPTLLFPHMSFLKICFCIEFHACLYILEINPLSVALFTNIFSHSVGCFFHFVNVFFFFMTHFERIFHNSVVVYSIGFNVVYSTKRMMSFVL